MRPVGTALAIGLVAGSLALGGQARAQAPADLNAGRQLFTEALADEEHGRFADAVGKYKRVQLIRDTANVRYRIGSSLEHLGKVALAVDAYTAAVRLGTGSGSTAAEAEVARIAQTRLDVLGPKVAHVGVHVPPLAPADTEVTLDGEPVASQALADTAVDPGAHVVGATAKGMRPFRAQINAPEGAHVDVRIQLEPIVVEEPPPPPMPKKASPYKTIGIVTAAAGGVLVVGGVVVLVLRSSAVGKINDACPGGNCPAARESELQGTYDRAKLEGPLGIALLATGVVAVGAGVALFVLAGRETKTVARLVPAPMLHGGMLTFAKAF